MKNYKKPELFTPNQEEVSAAAKRLVVESVSKNTTAMTKKQEKIKEAYGQYWESGNIDENGWTNSVSQGFLHEIPCDGKEMHIVYGHPEWWYRPKSLAGLEDNNGWISIESEADLPKESDDLFEVGLLDGIGCFHHERKRCAGKSVKYMWDKGLITHYQPIVKPKPPIY